VLSWLATKLVEETEAFLAWEKGTMGAPAGPTGGGSSRAGGPGGYPGGAGGNGASGASGAPNGSTRPAAAQTVPGDVVH